MNVNNALQSTITEIHSLEMISHFSSKLKKKTQVGLKAMLILKAKINV